MENLSLSTDRLLRGYQDMLLIRRVEEAIADRYGQWQMRCPVHLEIGQEAISAGVCGQLSSEDRVYSNHRAHGHYLAKGGDLNAFIAELHGKSGGCASGRGGSMHLMDLQVGFMGSTPIVGGTIPLAVGSAWSQHLDRSGAVTVVFFGDGCFEEGVIHESMNFAALHQLPVLFVCENNGYSVYTHLDQRQIDRPIHAVAHAHGLAAAQGDGNDYVEVSSLTRVALQSIRAGGGPHFLEFTTHRWLEHCGPNDDDGLGYRHPGELKQWRDRCPLQGLARLLQNRGLQAEQLDSLEDAVQEQVRQAFDFAEKSPPPQPCELAEHLYTTQPADRDEQCDGVRRITFAEALHEAHVACLAHHPEALVVGEGVPDPGGIFGTTKGLAEQFGSSRVFDSPLSENAVTGICIGLAINGYRPVLTHQRIDFALLSFDQLVNNAAKWRYLFGGRQSVPLVVRCIIGRGWGQGPQHGQGLHALFGHVPGLKVVMPATAEDAKGMLIAAVSDPDPVIFIEHRWLHHTMGDVPEGWFKRPLQGARIRRAGQDLTVAAFSHMVVEALWAAQWLAQQGVLVEVLDMRSVAPLDVDSVIDSVQRTGRLLVVDPGHATGGIAETLVAEVAMAAFADLKTAPSVIALPDHPLPTSRFLADHYYPDAADIALRAMQLCGRAADPGTAIDALRRAEPRDQPDRAFVGPF